MKKVLFKYSPIYSVIFFISLLIISMQILFIRIFSIVEGQSYTHLIISLALLGFGISGILLNCIKNLRNASPLNLFFYGNIFFLLSLPSSIVLYLAIPLNTFELIWDVRQFLLFLIHFIILLIPFIAGSFVICSGFLFDIKISSIYFFNMAGSSAGAIIPLFLLNFLKPVDTLFLLFSIYSISFFFFTLQHKKNLFIITLFIILIIPPAYFSSLLLLKYSQYKGISYALNLPEAKIIKSQITPTGILEIVSAKRLRKVNGLSLNYTGYIPESKVIYCDGNQTGIMPEVKEKSELEYLKWTSQSLPYNLIELKENTHILIVNPSGTESILRAIQFKYENITAIEENKWIKKIIEEELQTLHKKNGINTQRIKLIIDTPRNFFRNTDERYDIIELSLYDSYHSSPLLSLNENYLYTLESLWEMYNLLSDNGIISITRWAIHPYADAIKLFSMVEEMLRIHKIKDYQSKIAFIRSPNTTTICVSKTDIKLKNLNKFCKKMGFEILYPGKSDEENPSLFKVDEFLTLDTITNLSMPNKSKFIKNFPFDIGAPTDDRPYYHNFFKLSTLKLITSRSLQFLPFHEWGMGIWIILLLVVTFLGAIFILIPSLILIKRMKAKSNLKILKTTAYFFIIGIAYFYVELPLIQKLSLFLSFPIYSFSIVLSSMLLFTSLGSYFSGQLNWSLKKTLIWLIPFTLILYIAFTRNLSIIFRTNSMELKLIISFIIIAIPAFLMGLPFPAMIEKVKKTSEEFIPIIWAINGFASAISSISASLFSMLSGFNSVILTAAILYLCAAILITIIGSPQVTR